MNRSDTEPRRIGLACASSFASLRTSAGIRSRDIYSSYGYYIRRIQARKVTLLLVIRAASRW